MPSYYSLAGTTRVGAAWRDRPVLDAQEIEDVVAYPGDATRHADGEAGAVTPTSDRTRAAASSPPGRARRGDRSCAPLPPGRRPSATESTARRDPALRRRGGDPTPGRVHLDLPPLVENGNAVTITVTVDSPMTPEDHVRRIAVFNDKNPQPNVITAHLGPRSGRAAITTRIRLADTQRITAIAETSDGRYWSTTADAIVTLAACLEG